MKNRMELSCRSGLKIILAAGILVLAGLESALAISGTTNHIWHNVDSSASFIRGAPAFGDDGTIYVGSGDNNLYAFNPDGTTNHVWATGSDIIGSPVIGSNGTIYVASSSTDCKLWSFNPDGTTNFAWYLGNAIYGTPAIGADGTIYIGDLGHKFYALNPTDRTTNHVWTVGGDFRGHPAIGTDGTIYIGNDDHKLYAFNPNGTTNHVWTMNGQIYHGPAISSNGTIYIGDQTGYLWAFNPDGTTSHVWKLSDMVYHSSAAIGTDGRIYVGAMSTASTSAYCFALNSDGTTNRVWWLSSRYQMNSPVIGQDGTVFISAGYNLFALNPATGVTNIVWDLGDDMMCGTTIGPDNNIYVGCEKGAFYSLGGLKPMANTCSPRQHQNLKNTGSASSPWVYVPQNVSASDDAYLNRVAIIWDSLPLATTDYLVYRGLTATEPSLLGSATTNYYADTSATAGARYYYWVKATNAIFTSDLSAYDTGSRAATITLPRTPANVRASDGAYSNKIYVSWSSVSNAYAYEIMRSLFNATGTAAKVGSSASTNYNDSSAGIGTTYYYWVRSVNDSGTGRLSSSDSGLRATEVTTPASPQSVKASDGAYTSKVALTWAVVSNAVSYKVYRDTSDTSTSAVWICDSSIPLAQDTSITVGTLYYYWIRAINGAGLSVYSASDSGYASATINAPSTPAGVAATKGAYTDRVRVSWNTITNASSYEVYRNTANDSATAGKLDPDATSSPYDDSTMVVDTIYYYWVKAKNDAGASGFSSSDSGYATTNVVAPSAPTGVAATKGAYTDRVRVSWTAVSNASSYEVYRNTANDSGSATKLEPEATSSPFDDTTMVLETTYYYWVKAKNDAGASGFSSSDSGYATTTVVVPSSPTGISATKGAYPDRVRVSWNTTTSASAYEVYRNTANESALAVKLEPDTATPSWEDPTTDLGTTYYYWIKAKNAVGVSGFSASDSGWCEAITTVSADYDSDGKADPALYVESSGIWYVKPSTMGYALVTVIFGGAGYSPCVGDYDGDRKTDPAVYQESTGNWYVELSGSGYAVASLAGFGGEGYEAVAGDYDGDGKADPATYGTTHGNWQVAMSSLGYGLASASGFGGTGYTAVEENYDSDNRYDAAVYNNTNGNWTVLLSASSYITGTLWGFGGTDYAPVSGDFDGDGRADPAIYIESTATWQVKLSGSGYVTASLVGFGGTNTSVSAADYDGDGKADPTCLDKLTGAWHVKLSASGYGEATLVSGYTR